MDKEKVINGLERCRDSGSCDGCQYFIHQSSYKCIFLLHADTLALLKEQEVVVRCKDCKHSEPWYGDKSRCFLWHETGIDVFNDGFCNYGERQEGR